VLGVSKGAEAALLLATQRKDVNAVVLGMPSSVVWAGINWNRGGAGTKSSWSLNGEPLPHLPYGRFDWNAGQQSVYENGLAALRDHPDAIIPVETTSAPLMLICGEADDLWPSCPMARQIEMRAADRNGPDVTLLAYKDAGHEGVGTPVDPESSGYERIARKGGTAEGNAEARKDAWPKIVAFFSAELAVAQNVETER
jgi:pimeloyl-ACP methyl ester carboxylesterase